jgi:hypothetical protein
VSWTNIKTVNWNSLLGSGDIEVSGITKVFTLSSTSDLTNAQAAYNRALNGGLPAIRVGSGNQIYYMYTYSDTVMNFYNVYPYWADNANYFLSFYKYTFTISSWSVTNVTVAYNYFKKWTTAPAAWTSNNTITFVI